jgi:signal transduction histidine kinase
MHQPDPGPRSRLAEAGTSSILVVDDDPQITALLSHYLAPKGYAVEVAGSLEEGVRKLGEMRPDLILVDYHLPDGTGLDLVRRAVGDVPDVAAMVMTGVAVQDVQVAAEAIRSGAIEYVTKPFSLDLLESRILRSLEAQAEKRRRSREQGLRRTVARQLISLLEKERKRLAMELHDELGQTLTTLKMDAEMLLEEFGRGGEAGERLRRHAAKLASAIDQVRRISCGLRPSNLDALGLEPALRLLAGELERSGEVKIGLFFKGMEERLDPSLELAVYRIVQEALTNVVRHAKAERAYVNVLHRPGGLSIVVEDDGRGFEADAGEGHPAGRGGLGLLTMRERAEQFDGRIWIESRPHRGTCVTAEIPL